jgi:putative Mn2+ efflux pump MntP
MLFNYLLSDWVQVATYIGFMMILFIGICFVSSKLSYYCVKDNEIQTRSNSNKKVFHDVA